MFIVTKRLLPGLSRILPTHQCFSLRQFNTTYNFRTINSGMQTRKYCTNDLDSELDQLYEFSGDSYDRDLLAQKLYINRTLNKQKLPRQNYIKLLTVQTAPQRFINYFLGKDSQANIAADFLHKSLKQYVDTNTPMFINICNFDKEFATWFALMSYHMWFLSVRLRYEKGGAELHQLIFNLFWSDFVDRLHDEVGNPIQISRYKQSARDQYHGMWMSLDHGLLHGDVVLANSLHRNFFAYGRGVNAQVVEAFVQYTHRTILCLDYNSRDCLFSGLVCFPKFPSSFDDILLRPAIAEAEVDYTQILTYTTISTD